MAVLKFKDPVTGEWKYVPYIQPEADQSYNPESENAQSGLAVAQAVSDKVTIFKGEKILKDMPANDNYDIVIGCDNKELIGAKAGDLYINELENVICRIVSVKVSESNSDYRTITFRREEWNEAIVELKDTVGDIEAALDSIIAIQEQLIGGAE